MIDLRKEFDQLVVTENLGRWVLVRAVLKNDQGNPFKCRCTRLAKEPSSDCPECFGNGVLWVERPALLYCTYFGSFKDALPIRVGPQSQNARVFYAKSDYLISKSDQLVLSKIDSSGKIVLPVQRLEFYDVSSVEKYSSISGLPEFWKIYAYESTIVSRQEPAKF